MNGPRRLALAALGLLAVAGCGIRLTDQYDKHDFIGQVLMKTAPNDDAPSPLARELVDLRPPEQRTAEALQLDRAAAERGDPEAMVNLGLDCVARRSPPSRRCNDDFDAVRWFQLAMDKGSARAMAYVGYMTDFGRGGLPWNRELAKQYYRTASAHGSREAAAMLDELERDARIEAKIVPWASERASEPASERR